MTYIANGPNGRMMKLTVGVALSACFIGEASVWLHRPKQMPTLVEFDAQHEKQPADLPHNHQENRSPAPIRVINFVSSTSSSIAPYQFIKAL